MLRKEEEKNQRTTVYNPCPNVVDPYTATARPAKLRCAEAPCSVVVWKGNSDCADGIPETVLFPCHVPEYDMLSFWLLYVIAVGVESEPFATL